MSLAAITLDTDVVRAKQARRLTQLDRDMALFDFLDDPRSSVIPKGLQVLGCTTSNPAIRSGKAVVWMPSLLALTLIDLPNFRSSVARPNLYIFSQLTPTLQDQKPISHHSSIVPLSLCRSIWSPKSSASEVCIHLRAHHGSSTHKTV